MGDNQQKDSNSNLIPVRVDTKRSRKPMVSSGHSLASLTRAMVQKNLFTWRIWENQHLLAYSKGMFGFQIYSSSPSTHRHRNPNLRGTDIASSAASYGSSTVQHEAKCLSVQSENGVANHRRPRKFVSEERTVNVEDPSLKRWCS